MTPTQAIESLEALQAILDRKMADLRNECTDIANEWENLVEVGGGRDDHAASLLSRLIAHLESFSSETSAMGKQIQEMAANPFGR